MTDTTEEIHHDVLEKIFHQSCLPSNPVYLKAFQQIWEWLKIAHAKVEKAKREEKQKEEKEEKVEKEEKEEKEEKMVQKEEESYLVDNQYAVHEEIKHQIGDFTAANRVPLFKDIEDEFEVQIKNHCLYLENECNDKSKADIKRSVASFEAATFKYVLDLYGVECPPGVLKEAKNLFAKPKTIDQNAYFQQVYDKYQYDHGASQRREYRASSATKCSYQDAHHACFETYLHHGERIHHAIAKFVSDLESYEFDQHRSGYEYGKIKLQEMIAAFIEHLEPDAKEAPFYRTQDRPILVWKIELWHILLNKELCEEGLRSDTASRRYWITRFFTRKHGEIEQDLFDSLNHVKPEYTTKRQRNYEAGLEKYDRTLDDDAQIKIIRDHKIADGEVDYLVKVAETKSTKSGLEMLWSNDEAERVGVKIVDPILAKIEFHNDQKGKAEVRRDIMSHLHSDFVRGVIKTVPVTELGSYIIAVAVAVYRPHLLCTRYAELD